MVQMQIQLNGARANFDRVLRRYVTVRNHAVADSLNKKGADLGFKLIKYTPKAKASDINKGLKKNSSRIKGVPVLALVVNKRRRKAGKIGLKGPRLRAEMETIANARRKAIGFHKTGWFPGTEKMMIATRRRFRRARSISLSRRKPKGGGHAALPIVRTEAMIYNDIRSLRDEDKWALVRAFNEVQADMETYLARQVGNGLNTIN